MVRYSRISSALMCNADPGVRICSKRSLMFMMQHKRQPQNCVPPSFEWYSLSPSESGDLGTLSTDLLHVAYSPYIILSCLVLFRLVVVCFSVVSVGAGISELSCVFELAPSFISHPSLYAFVYMCLCIQKEFPWALMDCFSTYYSILQFPTFLPIIPFIAPIVLLALPIISILSLPKIVKLISMIRQANLIVLQHFDMIYHSQCWMKLISTKWQ